MGVYRGELRYGEHIKGNYPATTAIENLYFRFKEHGVGYQFDHPHILRVDSEFIHSEIVKPALGLLNEKHLSGAHQRGPTGSNGEWGSLRQKTYNRRRARARAAPRGPGRDGDCPTAEDRAIHRLQDTER